jgi:hypothetical protein
MAALSSLGARANHYTNTYYSTGKGAHRQIPNIMSSHRDAHSKVIADEQSGEELVSNRRYHNKPKNKCRHDAGPFPPSSLRDIYQNKHNDSSAFP